VPPILLAIAIRGDAILNIRTGLIAGLGLIAASGLAVQSHAANPATNQTPAATSGSAQPASPSDTSQSGNSQANNMSSNGSSGMSQQGVKALQQALKGQGENVKSDGVWGPGTQAALKHYQEQNGLPATGQLDQATRSKLNLQG
jgi:peptidoglycan hydrolase-like protein with peptidoglycan-binding domain